ncbi:MAG: helix-turn-helix transcriptional regulator [Streptococcus sp.]
MDIATLIKEYRTKTGMTQQELADKVFVTRQTISKWELGKSEPDNVSLDLFKEMNIEKESQKTLKLI